MIQIESCEEQKKGKQKQCVFEGQRLLVSSLEVNLKTSRVI